jgi:hypothetical protein
MLIEIICPGLYGKRLELKSEEVFVILYNSGQLAEEAMLSVEANCRKRQIA